MTEGNAVQRTEGAVKPSSQRTIESYALSIGAFAFVVACVAAMVRFRFEATPIAGPESVGQFTAIMSGAVAFATFVAGRVRVRRGQQWHPLDVLDLVAVGFAHGVIGLLSWTLVSTILEQSFIDATVFPLFVILLTGAACAVTGYVAFLSATHLDLSLLAIVLATFLLEGIIASMLTASDPHWWKEHLSALGMTDDLSALAFNLTLIVSGLLVTVLARAATLEVPTSNPNGIARVRLFLVLIGVFLGLVGVFAVDTHFWLHTLFASGMAVVFIVLTIRLKRYIPGVPRVFMTLGWLFDAIIVVLAMLYAVSYYTLTAVELVAGTLVFTWIILFIRTSAALQTDVQQSELAAP